MPKVWVLALCLVEFALVMLVLGGWLLPALGLGPGASKVVAAALGGLSAAAIWLRLGVAPR